MHSVTCNGFIAHVSNYSLMQMFAEAQVFENVRVLDLFQTTDYEYLYPKSTLFADTQWQPADVSKN